MSEVIVVGPDEYGLTGRFSDAGVEAVQLDDRPIGSDLTAAGIAEAGALVVTDAGLATLVSVAKEHNDRLTVVFYARGGLPPYASRQADVAVDPQLVTPDELVEAVIDRIASSA